MKDRFIFGDSIRESSENMALEFTKDATQKEFLRENKEFNDVIKPKEVFDTAELDGNDAHYTMFAFLEICKLPITNASPPKIKF
ncbi:13254_t:CDS:2 [Entrophospora sp. SA101]|nr:13254_t:CDS:2 [Entrophospora sp. SA101]CAJ0871660.1 14741_t:CDS:2 [Entrophospora sp. SA101]CAJ0908766.1 7541_t:CDS:2 [Entrophospora sp. SA101]